MYVYFFFWSNLLDIEIKQLYLFCSEALKYISLMLFKCLYISHLCLHVFTVLRCIFQIDNKIAHFTTSMIVRVFYKQYSADSRNLKYDRKYCQFLPSWAIFMENKPKLMFPVRFLKSYNRTQNIEEQHWNRPFVHVEHDAKLK